MAKTTSAARILVVDDEASLRQMMTVFLRRDGHETVSAAGVREALSVLASSPTSFDLVVSDLLMPDGSGLDVLEAARARSQETQVVIVTAHASIDTAVEAMRRGAYGYLEKPIDITAARATFERALEKRLLLRDNALLRRMARGAHGARVDIVGNSPAVQASLELARRAAAARVTVLITGESGTGKEVLARMVHGWSDRRDKPFVSVNCGAIPENLLESELFGHEKGAFTGASAKREGIFREADGGTLLLDEVGEIPLALQVKLLRVLQERTVRAVGASAEVPVDVRVLAATNRDLAADVKAGRFRSDLYYRLNVVRVALPPLRERREDIALLAEHFRSRFATEQGRPLLAFSPEALRALVEHGYPGNVRELENAVERAVTLAAGSVIELGDLPDEISHASHGAGPVTVLAPEGIDLERHLETVERQLIQQALTRANGVRTRAAQVLGLSFRSFRYRLAKLGITPAGDVDTE